MPLPAKSPERRQRRNRPKSIDGQIVAMNTAVIPDTPSSLPVDLADEWVELWSSELGATFTASDVPALTRYFKMRAQLDAFETEVFAGDGSAMSKGSTGQLTVHPLLKQADSLRGQILALEDRFGLNPQSRLKLGIALGQAQQSLDDMNRRVAESMKQGGARTDERPDPRLGAIDTTTG